MLFGLFKKIRFQLLGGGFVRQYFIFGRPIFQIHAEDGLFRPFSVEGRKKLRFSFCLSRPRPRPGQRVFYLKVHRVHSSSFGCIQFWMDLAKEMHAFVYFVCDNPEMKRGIYAKCRFHDLNFDFISSDRSTLKKSVYRIISTGKEVAHWRRVGFSLLTPFVHACKNNYGGIWNIDADDTLFLAPLPLISKALCEAERLAKDMGFACIDLDMFPSRTFGAHWSFGVVYVQDPALCIETLKENDGWHDELRRDEFFRSFFEKWSFNIDWFFTYLRDVNRLSLGTFYVENAVFVHMPDSLLLRGLGTATLWRRGRLEFFGDKVLREDSVWGDCPIWENALKIDVGLGGNEWKRFLGEFDPNQHAFEKSMLIAMHKRGVVDQSVFDKYR